MKKQLTLEDEKALATMASENYGSWTMPCISIGYSAWQEEGGSGEQIATIVKFDYPVTNTAGFTAIKHRIFPVSKRKPEGRVSALRF